MNPDDCRGNLVSAFELLVPHVGSPIGGIRSFGDVRAVRTGLPANYYNPVLASGPDPTADDVVAAAKWIHEGGRRTCLIAGTRHHGVFARAAATLQMTEDEWREPAMVMAIDQVPELLSSLSIVVVTDETLSRWHAVQGSGPSLRGAFGSSLLRDRRARLLLGVLDGEDVAVSAVLMSGTRAGIYAVATVEHRRGRGLGTALTWAAVRAGRSLSATTATLQSTAAGEPIYRRMGFIEVDRYTQWNEPEHDVAR